MRPYEPPTITGAIPPLDRTPLDPKRKPLIACLSRLATANLYSELRDLTCAIEAHYATTGLRIWPTGHAREALFRAVAEASDESQGPL